MSEELNCKYEPVLIIDFIGLPTSIKERLKERFDYRFHNDVMIEYYSEMMPSGDEMWSDSLTMSNIRSWYEKDVKEGKRKYEDFDDFIKQNYLEFDIYLIYNFYENEALKVKRVIIDICW